MSAHRVLTDMYSAPFPTPDVGSGNTFRNVKWFEVFGIITAGAEARTLAPPIKEGQVCVLEARLLAGNATVTVTGGYNSAGDTSIVFTANGQSAVLYSVNNNGTFAWRPLFIDAQNGNRIVAAGGAALTVSQALHDGKTVKLDQATGTAVTLPALTGSGAKYRFAVTVTKSGGSDVITAPGAYLFGSVAQNTDTANGSSGFTAGIIANAAGITTITLDGTTKGGRKGDWIEIEDAGTNLGIIRGSLNASGTEATPFS